MTMQTLRGWPVENLPAEEQRELARRAKTGDRDAEVKLVACVTRFVIAEATRIKNRNTTSEIDDLISDGMLAVRRALLAYDPENAAGANFLTFAARAITREMIRSALRSRTGLAGWTRLGASKKFRVYRHALLEAEGKGIGYAAAHEHAVKVSGIRSEVAREMSRLLHVISLDAPIGNPGEAHRETRMDYLTAEDEGAEERLTARQHVDAILARVPSWTFNERLVLEWRLLSEEPETLEELGRRANLTRERIRQIEVDVRRKLEAAAKRLAHEGEARASRRRAM